MMKIGFDISQTGEGKAGCGVYADSLIRALACIDRENEYLLYPSFGEFFYDPKLRPRVPPVATNMQIGLHHDSYAGVKAFWHAPPSNFEECLGNPDIVHANNYFAPSNLARAKLVYTLYDISFLENYSWTSEENRFGCFKGVFDASLTADWVVAISHHTQERFLEFFPHYPRERISVIYPASRFALAPETQPAQFSALKPRQFWLSVGTIEPRKNHHGLLKAYALQRARGENVFPLVLAGGAGWLMEGFPEEIRRLGLEREVIITGYVDDAALKWLYENAFCHVYVSLYEGFGMPVLESMSLGTSVVASNNSSIPEIVGTDGRCGLLVDPSDPKQIADAMLVLKNSGEKCLQMGEAARKRAEIFSWEKSAADLLRVYTQVKSMQKLCFP